MERVTSSDGTSIAYERSGQGPPLLLVHGTAADHTRWAPVLPALEAHATVHALDRRGRGASGDAERYSLDQEADDVLAVVGAIGGPVSVLGHSFGALCTLEAARRADTIDKLILYEPYFPAPPGTHLVSDALLTEIEALIDSGDRDGAVALFFRQAVGVSPEQLAALRALPVWQSRVAAAHTIPRETRADEAYDFDPERFRTLRTPIMLLLGGDTPRAIAAPTEVVAAALPTSQVVVMPGQQHIAMNTAPDLFVREVVQFLTAGADR